MPKVSLLTRVLLLLAVAAVATARSRAAAGGVTLTPLVHASVQVEYEGKVVLVDPWLRGDVSLWKPADLILITDDVGHHLDLEALGRLRKPGAPVVIPASARAKVPDGTVLANGETAAFDGMGVEAVAAYDLTPGEPAHPKGQANGYVLSLGATRILFAGVTECVPEIRALKNINVAFMPMNIPPGRMSPVAAAECTRAVAPDVVYVYHYDQEASRELTAGRVAAPSPAVDATLDAFADALSGSGIEYRRARWY